jgi:membrane glycosyltransferase
VQWSGQERDAYSLSWETAARGLWLQTAAGAALLPIVVIEAKGALLYSLPIWMGLLLSIPLAVLSASPSVGRAFARIKLCAIPEEFEPAPILDAIRTVPPQFAEPSVPDAA